MTSTPASDTASRPTRRLNDRGVYTEGLPEYKGKDVFTANPIVVKLLGDRGALLGHHNYKHSYPHCWRCHNPVIFRATEQWFIRMDAAANDTKKTLREATLSKIRGVKWIPSWGEDRMYEMIAERPDWCVSRQRFWGVPIIVFYCEGCNKRLEDFTALRNVVKWFEKEGADAWYKHSAEELLPAGTKCSCGESKWRKENDILDVWFDSGSSHLAVLKGPEWPADVYLEGPDQYRGWFHSSLLIGIGIHNNPPYKGVVTHGWTLDEKGQPMSKSLGNTLVSRRDLRALGRGFAAPLGRQRRISSRREDERARHDAAQRRLSQNSQHVPLRPRQSCRLRSVAPRAAQRSARRNGSLDARAHRRPRQKVPRLVFRATNSIASITRFTISASSISARFITTC